MLSEQIARLADLRAKSASRKEAAKTQFEKVVKTPDYEEFQRLSNLSAQSDAQVEVLDKEIRAEVLRQYKEDKTVGELTGATITRKPHPAVEVQEFTVCKYDEMDAYRYCLANLTSALSLDKKAFETTAKGGKLPAALVKVDTEPRVKLASDLSAYAFTETQHPLPGLKDGPAKVAEEA